jgi:hypothetical protein
MLREGPVFRYGVKPYPKLYCFMVDSSSKTFPALENVEQEGQSRQQNNCAYTQCQD